MTSRFLESISDISKPDRSVVGFANKLIKMNFEKVGHFLIEEPNEEHAYTKAVQVFARKDGFLLAFNGYSSGDDTTATINEVRVACCRKNNDTVRGDFQGGTLVSFHGCGDITSDILKAEKMDVVERPDRYDADLRTLVTSMDHNFLSDNNPSGSHDHYKASDRLARERMAALPDWVQEMMLFNEAGVSAIVMKPLQLKS